MPTVSFTSPAQLVANVDIGATGTVNERTAVDAGSGQVEVSITDLHTGVRLTGPRSVVAELLRSAAAAVEALR